MELVNPKIKELSFVQRKEVKDDLKDRILFTLSMNLSDRQATIDDVMNEIVSQIWDMKI